MCAGERRWEGEATERKPPLGELRTPSASTSVLMMGGISSGLFICLLLHNSFVIHWESKKPSVLGTKYHQEPREMVNRADIIVILSKLHCVQPRLRNGTPASLAGKLQQTNYWRLSPKFWIVAGPDQAGVQCLNLGADEDRGVLSAAMSANGRRQQWSPAEEEAQHGRQRQGGERLPCTSGPVLAPSALARELGGGSTIFNWQTMMCV